MSAVSRPMQVLLAAVLAFAALWFVALRPSGDSSEPAAEPAKPAAQATAAHTPQVPAVGAPATPAAAAAAPAGASAPVADRSRPLLAALDRGQVVVLLFWNSRASDDRAVRSVLREVDRHGGRVVVHAASVSRVAAYSAITNGAQVLGSPTALVIDRKRQAKQVTGFHDARSIDQAVDDALAGRLAG
jgi:hypothetical protein